MNLDIVAVDMKHFWIFDFLQGGETEEELLKRANKDEEKCQVMTYDDFKKLERERILSDQLKEITKEDFENAFEQLPPLKWCTIAGVEMFCSSEMWTGTYTTQYARIGNKYYSKMVDVLDKTTWIHNILGGFENA